MSSVQPSDAPVRPATAPLHGAAAPTGPALLTSPSDEIAAVAALARRFALPYRDLEGFAVDRTLIERFPGRILFERNVLPLTRTADRVTLAISDPYDLETPDQLTALTGDYIDVVLAPQPQIQRHLRAVLGVGGGTVGDLLAQSADGLDTFDDLGSGDDASGASAVIRLVNELLGDAVDQRASDIHLEPEGDQLSVRFRVDGLLRPQNVPAEIHRFRASIVSRLKIMARLNIAEKRLPQDGRIKLVLQGREIDVRVSVIPMLDGEGIVMRLLDKSRSLVDLSRIEFSPAIGERWNKLIRRSHGLLLVTGPTGSGKTTTLYSSLTSIRNPATKIITVEDPVEYNLPGINQIQVQSKIDLTFAAGLRSILRHDPDVVLIGEIRDGETAASAIQASMTGHLVFSTLHTNDSVSALSRLVDLGVEPYLVASTVEGVLAQRLVRRLCLKCREPYIPDSDDLPGDQQVLRGRTIYRAVGCRDCFGAGYLGRVAIFELLQTDRTIRQLCTRKASTDELKAHAESAGMQTLRQSGLARVQEGQTSLDEVLRVCSTGDD
ncbi:GspE/PulE family protein [Planctomyces sp. SH-PL14]|uniref:GspE/PulE family protein n=1 Tax=Planctomyces sp. SH-PL14 TaxID=1632864 RepID=UPI00078BFFC2|nr:ATPase, T2SS/T4P/T4SS family [Planctomyces sp. SH-PL14]AMV19842.1 Type II secretion system protein E [Planctomyces sp. SH-PL14]